MSWKQRREKDRSAHVVLRGPIPTLSPRAWFEKEIERLTEFFIGAQRGAKGEDKCDVSMTTGEKEVFSYKHAGTNIFFPFHQ